LALVPRRVPPLAGAALLFGLVLAVLFAPVLAGRATFVHGDALSVSLPLQRVLAQALARGELPLWSDEIYGGHPIFAEGQGGFAHPLNWLLFGSLPRLDAAGERIGAGTLYAHGLLHVLCSLVAALGTFGLARALGLGAAASAFAGLALACSQDWLVLTGNSAIALATAFVPALLCAVERWWQRPDVARACWLALALAAVLLAGYPQAAHAAAILAFLAVALRADRAFWSSPGRHLATGSLALAAGLALAAVQILPTLELVRESVRAGGVELVRAGDAWLQLRGLLFSVGRREAVEPGLGSVLVLGLALTALRRERAPLAYAAGSLFLLQLALADASPLHGALHSVLPGLDLFRITHLYGTVALVGVAVLAGFGAQRLAEEELPSRSVLVRALAVVALLAALCVAAHDEEVRAVGYAFPLAAFGVGALLFARRAAAWLPASLCVVLVAEIFVMRLPLHRFVDADAVAEPPPTARFLLERHPRERPFQVANVPHFFSYVGFASASTPGLDRLAGLFLSSLDAGSNLLWGVPSIHANLALPLARRVAVDDRIAADVRGESRRDAGSRFIDLAGVRYVVAHNQHQREPYSPELVAVFFDEDFRFLVRENPYARERIRLVPAGAARFAPDARSAAAELGLAGDALILEGSPDPAIGEPEPARSVSLPGVSIVESRAERHVVDVETREPAYLVVADAPYPAWRARLDGERVAIHPANVLGKAVAVPPGKHRVELRFEPGRVALGAWISLSAAALVAFLLWRSSVTPEPALTPAGPPG
jgi:hypothetical protein